MKLNIRKYAALMACACGLTITSCTGDLDVTPIKIVKKETGHPLSMPGSLISPQM